MTLLYLVLLALALLVLGVAIIVGRGQEAARRLADEIRAEINGTYRA